MAIDEDCRKAVNEKIERAIAQIDRGEGISSDELPARLRERKGTKGWHQGSYALRQHSKRIISRS